MDVLTKSELRVLRKMEKTPLLKSEIPNFDELYESDYIHDVFTDERDSFNAPIASGRYRVTNKYLRYKEAHKWFTPEYVLSHLVAPLLCAVVGGLLTALLLSLL